MDIDWVLGIAVFLFFVAWSFTFYFSVFRFDERYLDTAADIEMGKILDYMSIPLYSVPAVASSAGAQNDVVLSAGYLGYPEWRNTTRVWSGSTNLSCRIIGNNTYWLANLSAGANTFRIEFAGLGTENPLCSGTFSVAGATQIVPRALEENSMISSARMANMTSMGYQDFRKEIRTTQGFLLDVNGSTTSFSFGSGMPQGPSNVFVRTARGRIWETREDVNVTFYTW
jgi:hypothetical protein